VAGPPQPANKGEFKALVHAIRDRGGSARLSWRRSLRCVAMTVEQVRDELTGPVLNWHAYARLNVGGSGRPDVAEHDPACRRR